MAVYGKWYAMRISRLACIFLAEYDTETSYQLMRDALQRFLKYNGIDVSKYHETITHAWVLAVHHFMKTTTRTESVSSFIEKNPKMLDTNIMLTHYSAEVLFSDEARAKFVEPDLGPIPRHGGQITRPVQSVCIFEVPFRSLGGRRCRH